MFIPIREADEDEHTHDIDLSAFCAYTQRVIFICGEKWGGTLLMSTIGFNKLSAERVRKLRNAVKIVTVLAILLVVGSLLQMIFRLGGDESNVVFADVMYVVFSLFGACLAFRVGYLARKGPVILAQRYQLAWLCVGLGLFCNSLGGIYYTYLEVIHESPFPSFSDAGFTLSYPFIFVGLLLMPTTLRFRLRMGLDALIPTLCFFGISWFFVLGPAYFANVQQVNATMDLVQLLVGLSYPCWDILLILAIALIVQRRTERVLYPSFLLLMLGIAALAWADASYAYTNSFTHNYSSGTLWIDSFWFLGYVLMGLAGAYQYKAIVEKTYREQQQTLQVKFQAHSLRNEIEVAHGAWRRLQSLLLYVPLALLLLLTLIGEAIYHASHINYLVMLTAFISILVAVRYLKATQENEKLLLEQERERYDAEHLRQLNVKLTSTLAIEPLLENIVSLVTQELGFDAALLVLREKQYDGISSQSYMLVNTSSTTAPATNWRLRSDSFFSFLLEDRQSTEISWESCTQDIPAEIAVWQKLQALPTMHFFPLRYQSAILGCLGVAYKTPSSLKPHDISLLSKYIEQVVVSVRQAYLYEETYEQKLFAGAMINIAARLNSALVEPAEIQQLLCVEGTNALQADYTLLYVPGEDDRLVPLAFYSALATLQQPYTEWPPILPYETEAQTFYGLQPVLVSVHETARLSDAISLHGGENGRTHTALALSEQQGDEVSFLRRKLLSCHSDTVILAPLVSGGEPIGMLILGRSMSSGVRERQPFGKESLPMAQDFAEQASVAFTNAYLYQHLRDAHDKMQALDKLKDQFMVTASHELRTPLTAVQGYIELLSQYDTMLEVEQRRNFLQKARRSCEELVVMLGNVMDASRLEVEAGIRSVPLERVDVNETISSVITIIEPQVQQEQREVLCDIAPNIFVLADPTRLRQVLMNISVNALKYSPHHTPIRFAAAIDSSEFLSVILSITDKGKGIEPQDQARLFQRFVRLDRDVNSPVRGSGLGLYISKRLVEAMGGSIWIESSGIADEGTTFHIRLPVA